MHHVAILDDVFLAFQAPLAGFLGTLLAVVVDVIIVAGDFGTNETFLEIRMNHAGSLGRGGANPNSPGAHFLNAGGEVGLQAEQVKAGTNHPVQARFFHAQVSEEVGFFFVVQFGNLRFNLGADRHHGGIFFLGQLAHSVQQGVVLKATFVHVGNIHGGLQGQQVEAFNCLALIVSELHGTGRVAFVQGGQYLVQYRQQALGILVLALGGLGGAQVGFFYRVQVGQGQLGVDHGDIVQRGYLAGYVDHVFIVEAAHHVSDGVGFTDVGQEFVAQPFAFGGASDQAGNVHEFHGGGHDPLRADDGGEFVQTRVRHRYHAGVGFNGAEREVLGINTRFGQRVEQGGFAHVGQTDDTAFETHDRPPYFEGAMLHERQAASYKAQRVAERKQLRAMSFEKKQRRYRWAGSNLES